MLTLAGTASAQNSPYINKVYEFMPAPGQFINTMPRCKNGDTAETMLQKANDCIAHDNQEMICLGGFGGYVIFGFDHPVVNVYGDYDLQIDGNAFYADSNPSGSDEPGGSSEPGIVMVSIDSNANGIPDDEWYELAGSEYHNDATIHNYEITYYRPATDHVATPDRSSQYFSDTTFVRWRANDGTSGYIVKNVFHNQNYYPNWIEADSITFRGTKLRNNARDESGNGSYYVLYCFDWGYVDNHPNNTEMSKFNIDWAVDDKGEHVELDHIDFVKVYSAMNQSAGWLGETSTELLNAYDLHPDEPLAVRFLARDNPRSNRVYNLHGQLVGSDPVQIKQSGIYIVVDQDGNRRKIIVK